MVSREQWQHPPHVGLGKGSADKIYSKNNNNNARYHERHKVLIHDHSELHRAGSPNGKAIDDDAVLLTIAIDNRHSCPDLCTFVHVILPPWVRYRYVDFQDEKDLSENLRDYHGHVLIVARTNIINLANWAVSRRQNGTASSATTSFVPSTGLFHNADERVFIGEIKNVYHKFDYVLRHYYRTNDQHGTKLYNYTLHALGNYTCGTSPQSLPTSATPASAKLSSRLPRFSPENSAPYPDPQWGLHWVFLNAHTIDIQLLRHPTSIYPISSRTTNCSFLGRSDVKRSLHQRSIMKSIIETNASSLHCDIRFTPGFSLGSTKFQYLNYDLSNTKIGLCPRGSAAETHRLTELLRLGTVPALIEEDYLKATFIDVPAIIGKDWIQVAAKMRELIQEESILKNSKKQKKISSLEMLSRKGAKFYRDLEACMVADMDYILKGAFGFLHNH